MASKFMLPAKHSFQERIDVWMEAGYLPKWLMFPTMFADENIDFKECDGDVYKANFSPADENNV